MFYKYHLFYLITICITLFPLNSFSQNYSEQDLKNIANSIINDSKACVLNTLDSENSPVSRLMDPHIFNDAFEIYLITNPKSRKVTHLRNNNSISLNFISNDGSSYVSINGTAELINELKLKKKYWKSEWTPYYKDLDKDCILIKISPKSIELVSSLHNALSDALTWKPATIVF
tara:strand:- start:2047 stop:2568 length:522 start_codon:yes stop_codon:yes gene_type:complete